MDKTCNHKQIIVAILLGNYSTNIVKKNYNTNIMDNGSGLSSGHAVERHNEYVTVS